MALIKFTILSNYLSETKHLKKIYKLQFTNGGSEALSIVSQQLFLKAHLCSFSKRNL